MLLALLSLARVVAADEVRLKNGSVFTGVITSERDDSVTIRSGGGLLTFRRSEIAQVAGLAAFGVSVWAAARFIGLSGGRAFLFVIGQALIGCCCNSIVNSTLHR